MEVVATTFRRTSESRQVHSLSRARPFGRALPMYASVLAEVLRANTPAPQRVMRRQMVMRRELPLGRRMCLLVAMGRAGGWVGGLFEVADAVVCGGELVFEADDARGGGEGHVLVEELTYP
jgi:hypothetical protein